MWNFKSNSEGVLVADQEDLGLVAEDKVSCEELQGKIEALDKSQATIEFDLDGNILNANDNFLNAVGYSLDEIVGRHHRMFVEPQFAQSHQYREFWDSLKRGQYQSAEYKRLGRGNKEIWIQASYNPIYAGGKLIKVVKYATDITDQTIENANNRGQIEAINKSFAVIEFELDGTIVNANDNFTRTVGYSLAEIKGKHHRIFVDPKEHSTSQYHAFWENLNRGQFQAGEFRRIGNHGKEIWIQASYNPILDPNGKPIKVVKFASDITEQIESRRRSIAVGQEVASSVTQMVQTIDEISTSVQRTATLAQSTEVAAKAAGTEIESLSESSQAIAAVVDLIRDLAEQTNLLALNATIEAARAGEAGRGFAVVASEVKELAKQTSGATQDISDSVSRILSCIDAVVSSTQEIEQGVSKVSENTTTVAAAIEEQSTTMATLGKTANELLTISGSSDK